MLEDFRKGYDADKRKLADASAVRAERATAAAQVLDTAAELQMVKAELAGQRAMYDRLGFSSIPGGIEAVAQTLAEKSLESAELRASVLDLRGELQATRAELSSANRKLAQMDLADKRRGNSEVGGDVSETNARRAVLLARLTTLRGVGETLLSLLEHAKKKMHRAAVTAPVAGDGSPGAGSSASSPGPSPPRNDSAEMYRRAEILVADALSTLRSMVAEQEEVTRDVMTMARLLPPDEAMAHLAQQLQASKAREEDARAVAELAEEQRDAARSELTLSMNEAGNSLSKLAAKLSEQLLRAENLEKQLSAERARSSGLENTLTGTQGAVQALQTEKMALWIRMKELEQKQSQVDSRESTIQAAADAARTSAENAQSRARELQSSFSSKISELEAALKAKDSELETLKKTLAISEVQRAQAESQAEAAASLASRADLAHMETKADKISLVTRRAELQANYKQLEDMYEVSQARRLALETQLAELARKPLALTSGSPGLSGLAPALPLSSNTMPAGLGRPNSPLAAASANALAVLGRSGSPAHLRAYGPDEPLRPSSIDGY